MDVILYLPVSRCAHHERHGSIPKTVGSLCGELNGSEGASRGAQSDADHSLNGRKVSKWHGVSQTTVNRPRESRIPSSEDIQQRRLSTGAIATGLNVSLPQPAAKLRGM